MSAVQRAITAGIIIPFILIFDQVTKWMILDTAALNGLNCLDRSQPCGQLEFSPIFKLSMVWNRGMSFGALQSEGVMRWILVIMTVAIAIGFAVWLFRATGKVTVLALSLVVAGAIGNVIDRVRFGAVVDFIDVTSWLPIFPWVFNVADSAITVGAILLLADQLIFSKDQDGVRANSEV
ncbi:MAG: signal peptidase II [Pseudomonadota bacterium]